MSFDDGYADLTDGVVEPIMKINFTEKTDAKLEAVYVAITHMAFVKRVTCQRIEKFANVWRNVGSSNSYSRAGAWFIAHE